MMSESSKSNKVSIPVFAICFVTWVVFIVLKLTGIVSWSWLAVNIPIIVAGVMIAINLTVLFGFLLFAGVLAFVARFFARKL